MPITLTSDYIIAIKSLSPLQHSSFVYNPFAWGVIIDEHQIAVGPFTENKISREDVIKIYSDYYKDPKKEKLKNIMLHTMMWGFGTIGYGVHRTKKYLTEEHIGLFESALLKLSNNLDELAFKELMSIKGLGISYVSKILYFASRALNEEYYMLIFDIRVAHALVHLISPLIAGLISVYPSSKWQDYKRYNEMIHQVAQKYGLEAEALEMFLFDLKFIDNTR